MQNIPKVSYGAELKKLLQELIASKYPEFVSKLLADTSGNNKPLIDTFLRMESIYSLQPMSKYLVKHGLTYTKDFKYAYWNSVFGTESTVTYYGSHTSMTHSTSTQEYWWASKLTDEEWAQVVDLFSKQLAHTEKVNKLSKDLTSLANGCNTRQQLAEAAPEFEKYLPVSVERPIDRSMGLAIVNPSGLARELGWKP